MKPAKIFLLLLLLSATACYGVASTTATDSKRVLIAQTGVLQKSVSAAAYLTLEEFGAKGDGSDDTAAFRQAMGAIQAKGYGGIRLQPVKTYGIRGETNKVMFNMSNLSGFSLDATGGATIRELKVYGTGETAIAFQFSNCRNVRIFGGLRMVAQEYSGGSNTTGLTWFKFLQGCSNINADVEFYGGLHGFHFYRSYFDPMTYVTTNIKLNIKATKVYYPELHERSGINEETRIDAVKCGRAFFIFGGGKNINATVTTRNCYGFLISSDSEGNGSEDITIDLRDRNSDDNTGDPRANAGRCGLQFYNTRPAVFRNIKISIDLKNPLQSPFLDSFYIIKLNDASGRDTTGRGHVIDGLEITGVSDQVNTRQHITTYGAFTSPDSVRNVRIVNFRGSGQGSNILLDLGNALSGPLVLEDVYLPKASIKINHTTGSAVFKGYSSVAQ